MKNFKKVKILLICMILASCAAACSNNEKNPSTNDENSNTEAVAGNGDTVAEDATEPSHWDILGERDFERTNFRILDANDLPDQWDNMPKEEFTGEAINDALITRNMSIEEKFNVTLEYELISNGGVAALKRSVQAGDNAYDMVISRAIGGNLESLTTSGTLHDLASLPYLSLEAPWWSRLMYKNMQFDGKLFFTMGDIVPTIYTGYTAMFYNKEMYQDYGMQDNLYQMVFDGTWTLDVLERITKDVYQDVNGDNVMHAHDDIFGIIVEDNTLAANKLSVSAGINLSTVKDDTIAVDYTSQHVIDRVSRLTDVYRTNRTVYPTQLGGFHELIDITFAGGKSMFLVHFLESAMVNLRSVELNYGILPLPKYDEQQESYISFINPWVFSFVGIPVSADADKSAFIMEAMAYASYETVRPQSYEGMLHYRAARDEESARIIDLIIESSYLDLNAVYNWGTSNDILQKAMYQGGNLVSDFEKAEGRIQTAIDKYIATLAE